MLEEDKEKVLGRWVNFLPDTEIDFALKLYKKAKGLRSTVTVYPEQEDIFRVFKAIEPLQVKVVILGQNPQHDGNDTGIAFGCKHTVTPTVKQIWSSIKENCKSEYKGKIDPTFNHLLLQGVFLMNTILTVQEDIPLSHKYMGWERFTAATIHYLSKYRTNIVFMFWGNTQKFRKYVNPDKHLILIDSHPIFSTYRKEDWDCKHFNECNDYLDTYKIKPVQWR